MCGIIAYIGAKQVVELLLAGLKRMEYRGYDSAGVAVYRLRPLADGAAAASASSSMPSAGAAASSEGGSALGEIRVVKKMGKVDVLVGAVKGMDLEGTMGIGHTRWSTHGAPSDANAHPHTSVDNAVAVVHNGVIENYAALRHMLQGKGYEFKSETDTEVLAHLVYDVRKNNPEFTPEAAVRAALSHVTGAFGVCFMFNDQPNLLIGARRGSPLILGIMDGAFILASDASAIIEHTKHVVYLDEDEMVVVTRDGYHVSDIALSESGGMIAKSPNIVELEISLEKIERGGYDHFMLKEIMEQPNVLHDAMRGRINPETGEVFLGGLERSAVGDVLERMARAPRLIICACGTSFHAGLVGEYLLESMARISVEVEYASEFRYRNPIIAKDDVVIAISQSGETADTLAAVRLARKAGALCIGLVNVVGSCIARETDAGVYLHVGPEIGVASTKAFTGQVVALILLALALSRRRGTLSEDEMRDRAKELWAVPDRIRELLARSSGMRDMAKTFRFAQSFLYLGRGLNFPVALEGALKLKEISYIHAEGYAAAEMKHGPIALIDEHMPVVIIAPKTDPTYEKIVSNLEEVRARKGCIIVLTDEGNHELDRLAEFVVEVPTCSDWLAPLLYVVPLQLMSYYIAALRRCTIDQPRNLAKSVVVE